MTKGSRFFLRVVLGIAGGVALVFGTCWADLAFPKRETVQRDGWRLDWTHPRLRCHTCWGITERLEFEGRALPQLSAPPDAHWSGDVITPVGQLTWFFEFGGYHISHSASIRDETTDEITAEELASGVYELTGETAWARKKGTPASWIAIPLNDRMRWISPARAFDVGW